MSAVSMPNGAPAYPCPSLRKAIKDGSSPILEVVSTTFLSSFADVNAGRRATARSATLLAANRAAYQPTPAATANTINAWSEALKVIKDFVSLITPDVLRELDDLVAKIDDPTNPAGETLRTAAIKGMGFSPAEYDWCLVELGRAGYRVLFALSDGDPEVLAAMVDAAASGDNGILQIGFLSLSSSEGTNERVRGIISRSRPSGITASIFHFLPAIILSAATLGNEKLPLRVLMNEADKFGQILSQRQSHP